MKYILVDGDPWLRVFDSAKELVGYFDIYTDGKSFEKGALYSIRDCYFYFEVMDDFILTISDMDGCDTLEMAIENKGILKSTALIKHHPIFKEDE